MTKNCLNCKRIFRDNELVNGLCWVCDTPEIAEDMEILEEILIENNNKKEIKEIK